MKKWRIAILVTLFCLSMVPKVTATIDWEIKNYFKAETPTLDIASSFDGKYLFVLSPGKLQIVSAGALKDTLTVDPGMDNITIIGYDRARIDNKIILSSKETGEIQQISYDFVVSINTAGSAFMGEANAPVSLVIFSDFQ